MLLLYMVIQGERRQLPASPATIAPSITVRKHSQAASHGRHGDIRRNKEKMQPRPKSADMSNYPQEMMIPLNDSKPQDMELPHLHPPPVKKFLMPSDTPPSPASIAKMSPKVAASLEKINQLLASNPPAVQQAVPVQPLEVL